MAVTTQPIMTTPDTQPPARNDTTPAMSLEAQRIAIAKACGAIDITDYGYGLFCKMPRRSDGELSIFPVPDYLHDLNAMHEAEKLLTYEQLPRYVWALKRVIISISDNGSADDFAVMHATAAQRAEAFLRTLGLWVEDQHDRPQPLANFPCNYKVDDATLEIRINRIYGSGTYIVADEG